MVIICLLKSKHSEISQLKRWQSSAKLPFLLHQYNYVPYKAVDLIELTPETVHQVKELYIIYGHNRH